MDNQQNQNFTFGGDDNGSEFHDAVTTQRVEKLSQKVSFITFLIPCLIGIVIVFIYLDMKNKVNQVHTSGTTEIHKITTDLDKSISALQLKSTEIETTINTKINEMGKTLSTFNSILNKTEENINNLNGAKADKKSITSEIAAIKTESESLRQSIAELSSQNKKLITIAEELQNRTAEIANVKAEITKLGIDISEIQNTKLDINELNNSLKKQKIFYQLELKEISNKIDQLKATQKNSAGNSIQPPKTDLPKVIE